MVKPSAKSAARSSGRSKTTRKQPKPIKPSASRHAKRPAPKKASHLNGVKAQATAKSPVIQPRTAIKTQTKPQHKSSTNHSAPAAPGQPAANGQPALGPNGQPVAFDLNEKVKELVRLSKEQGYLTYNDINDALPDNVISPDDLDEIYTQLHNLDVEIVDQAEVDVVKQPEPEEEDNKEDSKMRLDILDDPVRMYLKQMGQVPLLTREQEVEICKRIEEAENQVKAIIYSFGFTGKEHIALAEKLISEPPKERFDRVIVDKKVDSRDVHLKELRRLVKNVRKMDTDVDERYAFWQLATSNSDKTKKSNEFQKFDLKLQRTFGKFFYKQKVLEDMA
ncbi:MAG: RNA polymerase sigma factor region1.1 domain-containing protein, partial [Limisphaerales bacterium]